jgi:hypothetical protein
MSLRSSPLCRIPNEVLTRIVLCLVAQSPLGPPSDVVSLLCTCNHIWEILDFGNNFSLWSEIFKQKFDITSAKRRGYPHTAIPVAYQLFLYCHTLREIRTWTPGRELSQDTLQMAYVMMLENDGKNRAQLLWAGLDRVVDYHLRRHLWENRHELSGWPDDNDRNTFVLWLKWFLTTEEELANETDQQRTEVMHLVFPYVMANCRYSSYHAPANHFTIPIPDHGEQEIQSMPTAHGEYPCPHPSERLVLDKHYLEQVELAVPVITIPAKLLYFARQDRMHRPVPSFLPATRADAVAHNRTGATQEDIVELNLHGSTKLPQHTTSEWARSLSEEQWILETNGPYDSGIRAPSVLWDDDWNRLSHCFDPLERDWTPLNYTFGSMNGLWQGQLMFPSEASVMQLVQLPDMPANFTAQTFHAVSTPIFMRLEEFHCPTTNTPLPSLSSHHASATTNWFAHGVRPYETIDGVRLEAAGQANYYRKFTGRHDSHDQASCPQCKTDRALEAEQRRARLHAQGYEHVFERAGLGTTNVLSDDDVVMSNVQAPGSDSFKRQYHGKDKCNGVSDIFFVGSTDLKHSQAWNKFFFYGRVRRWDGLIGILRIAPSHRASDLFLSGYLIGGQNFVGNWRMAHTDMSIPGWECAFSMSKRE